MRLTAVGILPTEKKLEAVRRFKAPTNATEVRSFLGLVTFVAKFIQNLADLARPLRLLTKKNEPWRWNPEQEEAFSNIKDAISNSRALAYFDSRLETCVIVDASPTGVGAILAQTQADETIRPVAYASRSLSSTEQRYSQTEREALGVKFGCLKFFHYLSGSQFKVISDHKPLVSLFDPGSRPPSRIERMALRIQDLQFTIEYQPGPSNPADVLSRQPLPMPRNNVGEKMDSRFIAYALEVATPTALSLEAIRTASESDKTVRAAAHAIRTGVWSTCDPELRSLRGSQHELSEKDGVLLKGDRLFIPNVLRYRCLQLAHQGHQGVRKTYDRLQTKVWWPGMRNSVEVHVAACISCATCCNETRATPLKPTELPEGPWLELGMDFLGPVRGKMLLVCTDHFSRFPLVRTLSTTTASTVIAAIKKWFSIFGLPMKITTDNGPPFSSNEFREFMKTQGVGHHRTTPLYPQANGATERCNQGLNKAIRASLAEGSDWIAAVEEYLAAYRRTPHTSTGMPPADLMFGRRINDTIPSLQRSQPVKATQAAIASRDSAAKARMKEFADKKRRATGHDLHLGDKVLRRRHGRRKTDPFFESDPWTVSGITGNTLLIQRGEQTCKRHVSDTKKWQELSSEEGQAPTETETIANRDHPREAKKPISYREPDGRRTS